MFFGGELMEFTWLYAIPRSGLLDSFFLGLTKVAGSFGEVWVFVGVFLLLFRKTRKTGAAVLISFAAVNVVGELLLKNLFARPRPCQIDQTFALLVSPPTSFSFPSTHSGVSFGAATGIFLNHKKAGLAAYLLAALIAFSRMYLFLHFPTDVLAGAILGTVMGILAVRVCSIVTQ
jgi:undecaprenyl-diphosphatase